jgi:hypothetical protein
MTDQTAEPTVAAPSELEILKARAVTLGITYHPSIGVDKLREKINAIVTNTPPPATPVAVPAVPEVETVLQLQTRKRREAGKLTRVIVTCMNPLKKEWEGEIFTAGNRTVGTQKKYVPFNNDEGWHVPKLILNMIKDRKCQIFVNETDKKGRTTKRPKLINEFAVTVLEPLTAKELRELAERQAMSHAID